MARSWSGMGPAAAAGAAGGVGAGASGFGAGTTALRAGRPFFGMAGAIKARCTVVPPQTGQSTRPALASASKAALSRYQPSKACSSAVLVQRNW